MSDTAENNVISLDQYESARRKSGNGPALRALEDVRELCRHRLIENTRYMMTKCDDTLYGCAQLAESSVVERMYLDAIDELKSISGDLENRFIDRFVHQFNLGVPRHIQRETLEAATEQDYSDIPYLKKERASENIAICKMIEKTRVECAEILLTLDRRIGLLIRDPDLELWSNPVSPEPICEAFRTAVNDTVRQLKHGFEMRPVLFNLFAEYVLGDMDTVYKELNLHLIKLGVQAQPETNPYLSDDSADTPGHQNAPYAGNPASQPDAVTGKPEQVTIQAESRFAEDGGLNSARQTPTDTNQPPSYNTDLPPQQDAGRAGDITIDVVAMLFERILENSEIADSMRALLGRLQIPFIKLAIQEPRFFSDKQHPARLLLNRLAESATCWDARSGQDDALYTRIDSIVRTVLEEFDQDTGLFATLLDDLEKFLASRESQPVNDAGLAAEVQSGEARLEEVRFRALEQVEARMRDAMFPDFINVFVARHWKDLLFLTGARQGVESDAWKQALLTLDDLLWSVAPGKTEDEYQRLMNMQPALLSNLCEGMHRLSVPVTEQDEFLARLMHAHAYPACGLNALEEETSPGDENGAVPIPDAVVTASEDSDTPSDQDCAPHHAGVDSAPGSDHEFISLARQLQPGTWIEVPASDGSTRRIKLSWMSPITKTYLFTDQKGLNAGNYSIEELALLLRSGRICE